MFLKFVELGSVLSSHYKHHDYIKRIQEGVDDDRDDHRINMYFRRSINRDMTLVYVNTKVETITVDLRHC